MNDVDDCALTAVDVTGQIYRTALSYRLIRLRCVVKLDVEATKKMLAELLAEPEPSAYEDLEPDYEYMASHWCGCRCH